MTDARRKTLKCPHCGAPLPPESSDEAVVCAFCGVASAPSAEQAAIYATVTRVAAPAIATEVVSAAAGTCPRCGLPLFEGQANGVAMLGCGRCGGVWLDNESAQRAVAAFDAAVVALADQASSRAAVTPETSALVSCPVCQKLMPRTRAPKSGIQIDVCTEHGTWFDRYELGIVLDALRPPRPVEAVSYSGPIPDFREGANPEIKEFGKIFGLGLLGMLGAAAGVGAVGSKS